MADMMTPEQRSRCMANIGSKNTNPEINVRRIAHAAGYRFRLHRRDLPGAPDLVFPARRRIVFVHGCFWHRHPGCRLASEPKTKADFWQAKFERNVSRDAASEAALIADGWSVLTIWECETRQPDSVAARLREFLGPPGSTEAGRPRHIQKACCSDCADRSA
ncbi:very short patch repair endonuclease [Methylobacterium sp. J-043]|nr:very short patch repair endonuclease [Methylobacterium sp. J-043]